MIHILAFAVSFLVCLTYALLAGGKPERVAILAQLAALLLSLFAISFRPIFGKAVPYELVLVDVALAIALTLLALKANRLWPILLAGMQVATVFAHVAKLLSFPLPPAGYVIFVQLWSWPMLMVTAAGTCSNRSRKRRFGEEPDWKPFWPKPLPPPSAI